jgi:leader peptidase (prepilin peptidase)/N-methyltransferase
MTIDIFLYVALPLVGLILGSFAGATVWRLRARQLKADKKAGERVDAKEYNRLKPLAEATLANDHSRCLHCGYRLRWIDLIPLVSWLSLGGRCRSCRRPIGVMEPLIELGVAGFFILSYIFWLTPLDGALAWSQFAVWLASGVTLAILFAYDAKWLLLPDKVTITLAVLGAVFAGLGVAMSDQPWLAVLNALGAVGILSGIYLLLYLASHGRWIGFGDVKLGVGLGLLLGDWALAAVALFLANLVGCLVVIPLLVRKQLKRSSHVPFGPLLIVGTILAMFIGPTIVEWYAFSLM